MFEQFRLNRIARRLKRCKIVKKSNAQLRNAKLEVNGKVVKPLDYIAETAKKLPPIAVNGKPIDYVKRMREIYYRNGLKGLNLYVEYIKLRTYVEKKKRVELLNSKR